MKLNKICESGRLYTFTTLSECEVGRKYKRIVNTHEGDFIEFGEDQISIGNLVFSYQPIGKGYYVWITDCKNQVEVRQQKIPQPGTPYQVNHFYVRSKDLQVNGNEINLGV